MAHYGGHGSDIPPTENQKKIPLSSMTKISREQLEQKIEACNELQEKYNRLSDEVEELRTSKAKLELDLRNARAIQVRMESDCVEEDLSYRLLQETIDEKIEELTTARSIQVRLESMCKKKDVSLKLLQDKLDRKNDEVKTLRNRLAETEKSNTGSEATYKRIKEEYEAEEKKVRDIRASLSRMESMCNEKDSSYKQLQGKFDRLMAEMETLRIGRAEMEKNSRKRDAEYEEMKTRYTNEKNELVNARAIQAKMQSTLKEKDASYRLLQQNLNKNIEQMEENFAFYKQLQNKYSEEMNKRTEASGCFSSWKKMDTAHEEVKVIITKSISDRNTAGEQKNLIGKMIELHMDLCLANRKENQPDIFINRLIERKAETEYLKKKALEKKNHVIAAKIAEDYWKGNRYTDDDYWEEEAKDLDGFLKHHLERYNK